MISGFNTDVAFGDVVYHIQTEDKGLKSRLIISLVYDRGTILASKRSSYEDLASGAFDENELAERLQKQHKLMCAAVKAGRIDDLKAMTEAEAKKSAGGIDERDEIPIQSYRTPLDMPKPVAVVDVEKVIKVVPKAIDVPPVEAPLQREVSDLDLQIIDAGPIFEAVSVIEDEAVLSPDAVAVVSELSGTERPKNTKLSVELLGDTKFKGGDRRNVNIMVCRGSDRKVISDAQIMIKVLGSSFRPMIFHAKTDKNGLATVHLQLPHFQAGRAAVLIRAISEGEEIEFRRIITPS